MSREAAGGLRAGWGRPRIFPESGEGRSAVRAHLANAATREWRRGRPGPSDSYAGCMDDDGPIIYFCPSDDELAAMASRVLPPRRVEGHESMRVRPKHTGDALGDQPGEDGSTPVRALQLPFSS